jgi:hypothetical protein
MAKSQNFNKYIINLKKFLKEIFLKCFLSQIVAKAFKYYSYLSERSILKLIVYLRNFKYIIE